MTTFKGDDAALRPLPGLTVRMAERLQSSIAAGELKPGERLPPEHELARHFSVSRTVVREAITRLKADGLVVSRRGAGAFVSDEGVAGTFRISGESVPSIASVVQLAELRMGVEAQCAALAAQRATATQLQRIGRALGAMASAIERGEDGVEADVSFHRRIAEAAENPLMLQFVEFLGRHLSAQIRISRLNTANYPGRAQRVLDEHRAIFEAISAHDSKRAQAAAVRHLEGTISRLQVVHLAAKAQNGRGVLQPADGRPRESSRSTKRRPA